MKPSVSSTYLSQITRKLLFTVFVAALVSLSCSRNSNEIILTISTESFQASINSKGMFVKMTNINTGESFLLEDSISPLMSIRINNQIIHPGSAILMDSTIILNYEDHVVARIKIEEKANHITFELTSITNNDKIELIVWGPYFTTLDKVIGETVGFVQGEDYTIGIQSLNIKTLGGYPWNESDRMPEFDIIRETDVNNMHPDSDGSVLYRVEAAKPITGGSSLQAYCRNRNKERVYQDVNHNMIIAPVIDDGGIIGSKIAIFGTLVEKTLETIGEIEKVENLPHPMIDGEWAKTSRHASAAYLITSFTEETIEDAIELTKKAGLKYLYHYGKTFENWGHFDLYQGEFPNGVEGLKNCVEKAEEHGIKLGTHCLSNFISTNDPYVTPVPDPRLAKVGSSIITSDIDANTTEIAIKSPEFFNQMKNNNLKTVMIGTELIRYGKVSEEKPWKLLDCQRGAFGTTPTGHNSGTEISKLLDHGYKVFLTNANLTVEMSNTLADLYNKTGMRQISFDGLEGNRSTGLGTYGESLMPYTWYNSLSDELKDHLIIDASRTTHFFWHIYTRMNWGEPWYAGFRESQTQYRFNNQAYFKRNFMPGMLGWFKLTPETTAEDIEWLLAKSAGYDAGYALVVDMESAEMNGSIDKVLELTGDWEKLRISSSFSEDQKMQMRNNDKEFSIERNGENQWKWCEINSQSYKHTKKVRQPGEPLHSEFNFNNPGDNQTAEIIISANECDINKLSLEINNYKKIVLPVTIKKGQTLKFLSGKQMQLYNSNLKLIKELEVDSSVFEVYKGNNTINIECEFINPGSNAYVKIEVRTIVKEELVVLKLNNS